MNGLTLPCILLVTSKFIFAPSWLTGYSQISAGIYHVVAKGPWFDSIRAVTSTTNGDVVVGEQNLCSVFVEKESSFLPICWERNTTTSIANTICRQLGFAGANIHHSLRHVQGLPLSENIIYIKYCPSDASHILRCTHSIISFTECDSRKVVSAVCAEEDYTYEGQLRLSKDSHLDSRMSSNSFGHLQVYLNNKWTPVCSDTFGDDEANTSCRQLGYTQSTYYGVITDEQSYSSDQIMTWIGGNETAGQLNCQYSTRCLTMCYKKPKEEGACQNNGVYLKCGFDERAEVVQSMKAGTKSICEYKGGLSKAYITGIAIGSLAFILICTVGIISGCYFCAKAKKPWHKSSPNKSAATVSLTQYVQNEESDTDEHEERFQDGNTYRPPKSIP